MPLSSGAGSTWSSTRPLRLGRLCLSSPSGSSPPPGSTQMAFDQSAACPAAVVPSVPACADTGRQLAWPAQVRGESQHTETLALGGQSAVPDDVAAGLLAGPLSSDPLAGAGLAGLMAEAVGPGGMQSDRSKKPKPSLHFVETYSVARSPVCEACLGLAGCSMWPPAPGALPVLCRPGSRRSSLCPRKTVWPTSAPSRHRSASRRPPRPTAWVVPSAKRATARICSPISRTTLGPSAGPTASCWLAFGCPLACLVHRLHASAEQWPCLATGLAYNSCCSS
jgi:hypothetical protein